LLHHDSLSLAVQTLGAAIEGAHWLNHVPIPCILVLFVA
jgi:hypothetical protein